MSDPVQLELPFPPQIIIARTRITRENYAWMMFLWRSIPESYISVWNPWTGGGVYPSPAREWKP